MIDLHSHILPNTDDGSGSLEESLNMLKEAKIAGFDTVCCTPHYFEQRYLKTKEQNIETISKLKAKAIEENIDINIILGNEIFISEKTLEAIECKKISCIGNTEYLLIELPMNQEIKYLREHLSEIMDKGYKIIIAHPERYLYVQKNPDYLIDFIDRGILFQSNYASILGRYGKGAEKTVKILLKNQLIHLFATDSHREKSIYTRMDEIQNKIRKVIDEEYFDILTKENPKLLLNNEDLITLEPMKKKKFFWEK